MTMPSIAVYAGGLLRPQDIMKAMNVRNEGFSTIIIDMFHIGNPAVKAGTQLGDIIFNGDDPLVIRDGKYVAASDWPGHIAELKAPGSKVTKLYAGFGAPRRGFTTSKPSRQSTTTTTTPFPGPSWKRIVKSFEPPSPRSTASTWTARKPTIFPRSSPSPKCWPAWVLTSPSVLTTPTR